MSLTNIINLLVLELHNKFSIPVVQIEQVSEKPAYPFLGYKIITSNIKESGQKIIINELIPSTDINFTSDIKQTATEQIKFTVSFSAYCTTQMAAVELSTLVKNFIEFEMYLDLKDVGAVIYNIAAIGDRTILLSNEYEYRYGFDVIIKMINTSTRVIKTVEQIIINMGE